MKKQLFIFFLLLFCQYFAFSQGKTIILNDAKQVISVGKSVSFLEDKEGKLTIEQILTPKYQQQFKLSEQEFPNFGNTHSVIWGKFTIKNYLHSEWLFEIANPLLNNISFFYPDKTEKSGYKKKEVGSFLPFANRDIENNNFLFILNNSEDSTQTKTFYFFVAGDHPKEMKINIGTTKAFLGKYHQDDSAYGIYFGIMLAMAFYNFFVYLTIRDKTYLYYVGYVLSISVFYFSLRGLAFEFIWANHEWINFYFPFQVSIPCIFIVLFSRAFLQTAIYTPRLDKGFLILILIFVVVIIMNLAGNYSLTIILSQLISLLTVVYALFTAIINVIYKNKVAQYYLLAWSIYLLSVIILFLQIGSIIPSNAFTTNAIFFGSALEVILLSFALANKINILKAEKAKSDKELLKTLQENEKLILEQNQVLEAKVKQRTESLQEANEELRNFAEELHVTNEELQKNLNIVSFQKAEIDEKRNELETSYQNISILSEIGKQITSTLDIKTIIHRVYDNVNLLMSAEMFGIGIYNEQTNLLEFDGFMEHGLELPFHTESLTENHFGVRCFLTQHEIIIHKASQELPNYQAEIGDTPESILYLPLIYQNKTLGIITVQSLQAHAYTNYHITMLKSIASYTASALDNALSYRYIENQRLVIESKNEDIMASINYANRIQTAMLPTKATLNNFLGIDNYFVLFKPRDVVSGDFYWCKEINGKVIIAVADCTGHGVPGAFVSMIGNATLNEITKHGLKHIHLILNMLHKEISAFFQQNIHTKINEYGITKELKVQDGMDIAMIAIDKENNKIEYTGAKNPLYYVIDNKIHEIKADKYAIGGHRNTDETERIFTKHEIDLSSNKSYTFYLATDGYQDQFGGEKNKKFMTKQLRELLFSISHLPMLKQEQILDKTMIDWMGNGKQTDDISLVGIRINSVNLPLGE